MKFKCELKKWRTQKKSVKITLLVKPEDIPNELFRFEDMPLHINFDGAVDIDGEIKNIEQLASGPINIIIQADRAYKREMIQYGPRLKQLKKFKTEFMIDEEEQIARLNRINGDQRAKAYATIRDIAESLGYEVPEAKRILKDKFLEVFPYESISLSDCSKTAASEFIDFSIRMGYEMGVEWKDHPRSRMDNLDKWLRLCLDQKICSICGKPGEIHHCEGSRIGMGRNRNKIDDSNAYVVCLCRVHHTELHNMPESEFLNKYHIEPILKESV